MKRTKNPAYGPTAYVTKRKQRIKQFNETVYLNNGDEFEIELFNPTTNKVLAVIQLNGKNISDAGVVLRPGERVFLERYLDTSRKFLFETYNVSGGSNEVKRAIESNGKVSVKFYNEAPYESPNISHDYWKDSIPDFTTRPFYGDVYGVNNTGNPPPHMYYSSTVTLDGSVPYTLTNSSGTVIGDSLSDKQSVMDYFEQELKKTTKHPKRKLSKSVETGRIEKGSHSNQTFIQDTTKFNSYPTWEWNWQIYPTSQKRRTIQELNQIHCTECGARRRKDQHKFCPLCGTRYE